MVVYMVRDGQAVVLPQIVIFGALTIASVGLMVRFLLTISPGADPTVTQSGADREFRA
jgi:hypothetical protein